MSGYGELIDKTTLRIERILPGPIERVWAYLVESDKRAQWLGAGAMELRKDGKAAFVFDHRNLTDEEPPAKYKELSCGVAFEGRVLAVEPPLLLRFTWPEASGAWSEVEIRLAPQGEEVVFTLTHSKLVLRSDLVSTSAGWHTHLDILAAILAGKTHRTFWSQHSALEAEYDARIPRS
jgi:uncharacterized protein YndB with AHSA1/START domain